MSQIDGKADSLAKPYNGDFTQDFNQSYDFSAVSFYLGGVTIKGNYNGYMESMPIDDHNGTYTFDGQITYNFSDTFSDPLSILEMLYGTSNPNPNNTSGFLDWLCVEFGIDSGIIGGANFGGTSFSIVGTWTEQYSNAGIWSE
jgi:hypothetical protein